ncbi:MAG: type II toxin-antitoxin system RelE/ParE family toxin [Pseudodesulfovibrio sp.]|uniref:type II toxin-antitoxin system RelE/ParE family toxin n=1 Tax=Pseudodesulfovibrio sp. TaxID=2035812 RepID=UPI003D1186E1
MEAWSVKFLDAAFSKFESLPADIRARFQRIFRMVREEGLDARVMPYSRPVKGRLWEVRAKGKGRHRERALCGRHGPPTCRAAVLRKENTSWTPPDEIKLALKRCREHGL